jgi:hypothetical protein
VEIFDLGGSKNVRRIWKAYFSEVHAVVYVVDATDKERFGEARIALEEALAQAHLADKPVLVYANKQDMATAASPAEVAVALGLDALKGNRFSIVGCTARVAEGKQPDPRLRDGFLWAISQVNAVYTSLDTRVKAESAVVKAEAEVKKKEREVRANAAKEERYRRQAEQEAADAAGTASAPMSSREVALTSPPEPQAQGMRPNPMGAVGLPNQIESPKGPALLAPGLLEPALLDTTGSPMGERPFSDPFSDTAGVAGVGGAAAGRLPPSLDDAVGSAGPRDLRPTTGSSVARAGSASRMSRQGSRPGSAAPGAQFDSVEVMQDELPERPSASGHRGASTAPPPPLDEPSMSGLAEPAPAPAGLPPVATTRPGSGLTGDAEEPVYTPSPKDAPGGSVPAVA